MSWCQTRHPIRLIPSPFDLRWQGRPRTAWDKLSSFPMGAHSRWSTPRPLSPQLVVVGGPVLVGSACFRMGSIAGEPSVEIDDYRCRHPLQTASHSGCAGTRELQQKIDRLVWLFGTCLDLGPPSHVTGCQLTLVRRLAGSLFHWPSPS